MNGCGYRMPVTQKRKKWTVKYYATYTEQDFSITYSGAIQLKFKMLFSLNAFNELSEILASVFRSNSEHS